MAKIDEMLLRALALAQFAVCPLSNELSGRHSPAGATLNVPGQADPRHEPSGPSPCIKPSPPWSWHERPVPDYHPAAPQWGSDTPPRQPPPPRPFGRDHYPILLVGGADPDITIPAPELDRPSDLEVLGAAFRRENEVGSILSDEMFGVNPYENEDGFDFQAAAKAAGFDGEYLDRYAAMFNQRAADALTAKIKREREDPLRQKVHG